MARQFSRLQGLSWAASGREEPVPRAPLTGPVRPRRPPLEQRSSCDLLPCAAVKEHSRMIPPHIRFQADAIICEAVRENDRFVVRAHHHSSVSSTRIHTVQHTRSKKQRSLSVPETSKLHDPMLRRMTMHVGYARVSTREQTIDLQVDALTQAGCTNVYTEVISGARADRPILAQVLETLRAGDVLVIWKLDRLGRSLTHLLTIVTDLMTRQVGLKSLNDPIDTTTPQGRLIFNLFASLAEFEREVIRERTQAGLSAARARGRLGGRPKGLPRKAEAT